jgi:hypothetical protein
VSLLTNLTEGEGEKKKTRDKGEKKREKDGELGAKCSVIIYLVTC